MANKTEQEKALDKIKKCLRLAGSSNANEAATAMRQAQAMMDKYSITFADVQAAEASESTAKANVKTKPTKWEAMLAFIAADAFGCKLIFTNGVWRTRTERGAWSFIGIGSSPQLASYAFEVLLRQVKRDRAEYIKTQLKRCNSATKTARADNFCMGWIGAVRGKIAALATSKQAEASIAAYMKKNYGQVETLTPRSNNGRTARNSVYGDRLAGHLEGRKSTLNRGMSGHDAVLGLEAQNG